MCSAVSQNQYYCFPLLFVVLVCGCQTSRLHYLRGVADFENGQPDGAIEHFDEALRARGAEEQIVRIDRGIAALMAGRVDDCEAELRAEREELRYLEQLDIREQAMVVLSDDQSASWTGREFERSMVDSLLLLSSLLGNRQDAYAYSVQASERLWNDKTGLVQHDTSDSVTLAGHSGGESVPRRFAANSFSAYLQAAVFSESPLSYDVADRAVKQVAFWNSSFEQLTATSNTEGWSGFGTATRRGNGAVHVITFFGRVTDWHAETVAPTSAALLIADQILSSTGKHSLPPTIAPVQIATPSRSHCDWQGTTAVQWICNDQPEAVISRTLVDLNAAARNSYENSRDEQIARAVVRRIVKKGAVYTAKDSLAVPSGSGVDVLLNLGGIMWEAIEKPDTRHLSLLPERIDVARLELPSGQQEIQLASTKQSATGKVVFGETSTTIQVPVDDGRNTFVLCFQPTDSPATLKVVSSR